jgi:hypothetical protein
MLRKLGRTASDFTAKILKDQQIVKARLSAEVRKAEEDLPADQPSPIGEYGARPKGPEPTRFGDWERKGRVSDF